MNPPILLMLFVTFLATWLVGSIPTWRYWKDIHLNQFISFSAGVLIATAFLHVLPDAIAHSSHDVIGMGILFGFLLLFILEKFVMIHPCEESHCDYHSLGLAAFIGIGLHSIFDGIALGSSLAVPGLAQAVFLAIIFHKMPSSFALASLLKAARWSTVKIHAFLLCFSLIIPTSAWISYSIINKLPDAVLGHALNISLGSFLYIATSDFMPEIHKKSSEKFKNFLAFLLGIVIMVIFLRWHEHV